MTAGGPERRTRLVQRSTAVGRARPTAVSNTRPAGRYAGGVGRALRPPPAAEPDRRGAWLVAGVAVAAIGAMVLMWPGQPRIVERPLDLVGRSIFSLGLVALASYLVANRRGVVPGAFAWGAITALAVAVWVAAGTVAVTRAPGGEPVLLRAALLALGSLAAWAAARSLVAHTRSVVRDAGAARDALTRLLNRAGIIDYHSRLARGAAAAVLMVDVNDLKLLNDQYGHSAGDEHIVQVARALEAALPPGGVAGRWGGDEFVAVLPGGTERVALEVAARAEAALGPTGSGLPPFAAGAALTVGGQPIDRALAAADARMYEAKESQREALAALTGERIISGLDEFSAQLENIETPEDIGAYGLAMARDFLGFDAAFAVERRGEGFVLTSVDGPVPAAIEQQVGRASYRAGSGVVGRAIAEGRTAWSADYPSDPAAMPSWVRAGLKSMVVVPVREGGRLVGLLGLLSFRTWRPITPQVRRVLAAVALRLGHALERDRVVDEVRRTLEGGLLALGLALEGRDLETSGHTTRVVALAGRLAKVMGLRGRELDELRQGAYLHDLGKITVPDAVLNKPGKLDPTEWLVMQAHASRGSDLASRIPTLPAGALEVIRHHHERWDGSGYPDGLRGAAIPLKARIFAVCDVFDALTSGRPYKHAWSQPEAVRELQEQAGKLFDPAVVEAFVELVVDEVALN